MHSRPLTCMDNSCGHLSKAIWSQKRPHLVWKNRTKGMSRRMENWRFFWDTVVDIEGGKVEQMLKRNPFTCWITSKRRLEVWQESVTVWPQKDHVSPDLCIFQMDVRIYALACLQTAGLITSDGESAMALSIQWPILALCSTPRYVFFDTHNHDEMPTNEQHVH